MQKTKKHIKKKTHKKIRKHTLKIKKIMRGGEDNFENNIISFFNNISNDDDILQKNDKIGKIMNIIMKVLETLDAIYDMFYKKIRKYVSREYVSKYVIFEDGHKYINYRQGNKIYRTPTSDYEINQKINLEVLKEMKILKETTYVNSLNVYNIKSNDVLNYIIFIISRCNAYSPIIYDMYINDISFKKDKFDKMIDYISTDTKDISYNNNIYINGQTYENNFHYYYLIKFLQEYKDDNQVYLNDFNESLYSPDMYITFIEKNSENKYKLLNNESRMYEENIYLNIKLNIFLYLYIIKLFVLRIQDIWLELYFKENKSFFRKYKDKYNTRADKVSKLLSFIKEINSLFGISDDSNDLEFQIDKLYKFINQNLENIKGNDKLEEEIINENTKKIAERTERERLLVEMRKVNRDRQLFPGFRSLVNDSSV